MSIATSQTIEERSDIFRRCHYLPCDAGTDGLRDRGDTLGLLDEIDELPERSTGRIEPPKVVEVKDDARTDEQGQVGLLFELAKQIRRLPAQRKPGRAVIEDQVVGEREQ